MHDKHFIVIVYDISNDKRRTKLHKLLKNFGSPVQYSVFECILSLAEIEKMKKDVKKILRPKTDHLRYYSLCNACKKKVEIIGRVEIVEEKLKRLVRPSGH
ncbi:MAG: CRISPR-associated endonuclease Cas2 [Anaerolineaceae bacterium]